MPHDFHIDTPLLVTTLRDLVRINSVNPDLAPGAPGESPMAAHLDALFRRMGLDVSIHEATPGRPSVVARLVGRGGGRSLMLNAHIDTVDVEAMSEPFSGAVRDGRLYGRGSYDMKGGLAAIIAALQALIASGEHPRGDIVVAAVADEEFASLGTQEILRHCRTDGAIVTEPTALDVCLAHKGFLWFEVEVQGRAAHGSRFDLGVDAVMHAGRILQRLDVLERDLRLGRQHPLVGPASLHAATIRGGSGLSTYAASCVLQVERRTIPGETAAEAERQVRDVLAAAAVEDSRCRVELRVLLERPPFEVAPDSALLRTVTHAVTHVRGEPPEYVGQTPWMDSALLAAAGIETLVLGGDGAGAHAAEEWADLASLGHLARILALSAAEYCR
jgi:acetylornithine deacetylase